MSTRQKIKKSRRIATRRSGARKGSKRSSSSMPTTVPFAYLYSTSIGSTSPSSTLFNPTVIPTLTQIAACYQNFRFINFNAYLIPGNYAVGSGDVWAVGFSTDVSAGIASITSTSQVSQCMPSAIQNATGSTGNAVGVTLPTAHLRLGPPHLLGNTSLKWFKCIGDADTNAWENFQFQLIFYNSYSSTVTFSLMLTGKCQFSSPIPTQLTSTLRYIQSEQYLSSLDKLKNLTIRDDESKTSSSICKRDEDHGCPHCKMKTLCKICD